MFFSLFTGRKRKEDEAFEKRNEMKSNAAAHLYVQPKPERKVKSSEIGSS